MIQATRTVRKVSSGADRPSRISSRTPVVTPYPPRPATSDPRRVHAAPHPEGDAGRYQCTRAPAKRYPRDLGAEDRPGSTTPCGRCQDRTRRRGSESVVRHNDPVLVVGVGCGPRRATPALAGAHRCPAIRKPRRLADPRRPAVAARASTAPATLTPHWLEALTCRR